MAMLEEQPTFAYAHIPCAVCVLVDIAIEGVPCAFVASWASCLTKQGVAT